MGKYLGESNPVVSFIVPFYNAEDFLRRCIDSVLQQEFRNFELILVNDGSNDRSLDICYSYDDSRIFVINHNTNLGVSQARNSGLIAAKGKWIAFVDADDIVSTDFLVSFFVYHGDADLITLKAIKALNKAGITNQLIYTIILKEYFFC